MTHSAQSARPLGARIITLFALAVTALLLAAGSANAAPVPIDGVTYWTTGDLCKLTVSPKTADALTGTIHTFNATVTAVGPDVFGATSVDADVESTYEACLFKNLGALEGVTVKFTVVSGPNAGATADVPLNASAVASYSYSSAAAGTDVVVAELKLPDTICYSEYLDEGNPIDRAFLPGACSIREGEPGPFLTPYCGELQVSDLSDCPTVTLSDDGLVNWSAPAATVTAAAAPDPSIAIAKFKRCVSRSFKITPSYSGGEIKSSTLFIDGKKTQTRNGSAAFTVNAKRYKTGKHNFEVVTVFTSGKAASKFGAFSRCAVRSSVKRVSPQFTG